MGGTSHHFLPVVQPPISGPAHIRLPGRGPITRPDPGNWIRGAGNLFPDLAPTAASQLSDLASHRAAQELLAAAPATPGPLALQAGQAPHQDSRGPGPGHPIRQN